MQALAPQSLPETPRVATQGFGHGAVAPRHSDAAANDERHTVALDSHTLEHAARRQHALQWQRLVARLARAVAATFEAWQRRSRQLATERALDGLDPHLLRDLGLTPSDVPTFACELAGTTDATRVLSQRFRPDALR
jgi:uncharacterized protein YjiS (DUF1127 family)